MESETVRHPPLPAVHAGVVLSFVCPSCLVFSRKFSTTCGCYACTVCGHHSPTREYAAACQLTGWLVNHPSPQ